MAATLFSLHLVLDGGDAAPGGPVDAGRQVSVAEAGAELRRPGRWAVRHQAVVPGGDLLRGEVGQVVLPHPVPVHAIRLGVVGVVEFHPARPHVPPVALN